jgi:hypothetical protein
MLTIFATVSNSPASGRGASRPLSNGWTCRRTRSKSYVSRILRLALLAPDIVESVVAGKTDQTFMLETLEQPLPGTRSHWQPQGTVSRWANRGPSRLLKKSSVRP